MNVLYICVGICMFYGIVDCEMIANNTFDIFANSPFKDGIWSATVFCKNTFSVEFTANNAWIVSRFGVPVTDYQKFVAQSPLAVNQFQTSVYQISSCKDYMNGNWSLIDAKGKWVITTVGYGIGHGSIDYYFLIEYDQWLGAGAPSGDCHMFTDRTEAENYANTAPELSDPLADTLIDTTQFYINSSAQGNNQGACYFEFDGIRFGRNEAVILVNFKVPIEYLKDYSGDTVLHTASDFTWYIVSDTYAREDAASYIVDFKFRTTNEDISNAYCTMYVSEEDAVTASTSIGATTGSSASPIVTTNSLTLPIVSTNSLASPTVATHLSDPPTVTTGAAATVLGSTTVFETTVTLNPGGTTVPVIVPHPLRHGKTGHFVVSQEMHNKYVSTNSLWEESGVNAVHCGRLCLADDICVSVFHHEGSATCTGHQVVYGSGSSVPRVTYYVFISSP